MGVLDGKSAIVTGSARGIGRATAELLASQGAQVLINDLDGDVAQQAAGEIAGETAVFAGDLTKTGAADDLVGSRLAPALVAEPHAGRFPYAHRHGEGGGRIQSSPGRGTDDRDEL